MDYEKKYKEALERARQFSEHPLQENSDSIVEYIFPELKESEDDRIRKGLITFFSRFPYNNMEDAGINAKDVTAWLEKQVEQDNNEDLNILQRFSFYSYKDEPQVLYLSNVFVNEKYRNKGIGTKILKIADEVSTYLKCNSIRLKTENGSNAESLYRKNGYKTLTEEGNQIWLEKQGEKKSQRMISAEAKEAMYDKPAWREEDEQHIDSLLKRLDGLCRNEFERTRFAINEDEDWLKSLKQRIGG